MGTLMSTIALQDKMTKPLMAIQQSLSKVTNAFMGVQSVSSHAINTSNIQKGRQALSSINDSVLDINDSFSQASEREQRFISGLKNANSPIEKATTAQKQFNQEIDNGNFKGRGLLGTVTKIAGAIGAGLLVKKAFTEIYSATTELEATEAKFNTVFSGMTGEADAFISEFKKLTPATITGARTMASGIQDLLVPMGFARKEATGMTGVTMHLIGALTNFNSASQTAETVTEKFQSALTGEYTGLKALGIQVNDTIVKQKAVAMGLASTTSEVDTQAKAQALLKLAYEQSGDALDAYNATSLDTKTRMGLLKVAFTDTFANAGQTLLPKINDLLKKVQDNMPLIQTAIVGVGQAFGVMLEIAINVFNILMSAGSFIADNWSWISPIIWLVVGALIAYQTALLLVSVIEGISIAYKAVMMTLTWLTTTATWAQVGAQWGLNTALYACPLVWIILLVIALIAVFYGVIAVINKFAGTSYSATGLIAGYFSMLGSVMFNVFAFIWNYIANFVNFFANVFKDPVSAVKVLFLDMATAVLGYLQTMLAGIEKFVNKIPGVEIDITSGLDSFSDKLKAKSKDIKDKAGFENVMKQMDYKDLGQSFDKGYNAGSGFADKVGGMFSFDSIKASSSGLANQNQSAFSTPTMPDTPQYGATPSGGMGRDMASTAGNTAAIKDSVSKSEEDLKYLRDIAEREAVNRFTTAEIRVEMNTNANINNLEDIDGIVDRLESKVREGLESAREGVSV